MDLGHLGAQTEPWVAHVRHPPPGRDPHRRCCRMFSADGRGRAGVVPTDLILRTREDRELFLSGLRPAAGETV